MQKKMKIYTKRLELTNFKAEYAEEFTKVLSDPKIFLYLPESVPTINDIENLIQWFIERDLKNVKNGFKGTNLAVFHKENKKIIFVGAKMDNYIKITVLENTIEAQLIDSILSEKNIPHRIRSFHDTAYDGLFQFQKGWGELYAPLKLKSEILKIIEIVRSE